MPHNRFFLPTLYALADLCTLQGEEFHHAKHVMRQKIGDELELVNGQGQMAMGTIRDIKKDQAIIEIHQVLTEEKKQGPELEIALSIIKIPRLEWAVEKLTELGVDSIALFAADHSELSSLSESKIGRLEGIMIAALKQCGRLFLPKLSMWKSLEEIPPFPGKELFADFSDTWIEKPSSSTRIFIGPESGWTELERKYLSYRAKAVRLAPHVLRAETAAIAACCHLR